MYIHRQINKIDINILYCNVNIRFLFVTEMRIANHSTEFVNKVLDNIRAGIPDGGIDNF